MSKGPRIRGAGQLIGLCIIWFAALGITGGDDGAMLLAPALLADPEGGHLALAPLATAAGAPSQTGGFIPRSEAAAACAEGNEYFAVVGFTNLGPGRPTLGVVAGRDTEGPTQEGRLLLSLDDVGAVFGLAYDHVRHDLYVGGYHKTFFEATYDGPGAVYRLDLDTGELIPLIQLEAGTSPHGNEPGGPPPGGPTDTLAAPLAGKTSLGDIDVNDDATVLFAVNLHRRRIERISIPDGRYLGSLPIGSSSEPWSSDARPFGLGYRGGWLYHGVVNSAEDDAGRAAPFHAYVYRSRDDGSAMTKVVEFDLDYRDPPWEPWRVPDWIRGSRETEPLLADIEFAANGDMVLGLRDRAQDAFPSKHGHSGQGDILLGVRVSWDWWDVATRPEHFRDDSDFMPAINRSIEEASWGSVSVDAAGNRAIATVFGASTSWFTSGLAWFDIGSGERSGPADGREALFDTEQMGTGDVEGLCEPSVVVEPTGTPTPESSVTPAPSTTVAAPYSAYLPVLDARECRPSGSLDVVLVIDASTSMLRRTPSGNTKLSDAQAAASAFVALTDLPDPGASRRDLVALVGFNSHAWTAAPLTNSRSVLEHAIYTLDESVRQGTRLDLALIEARSAVTDLSRTAETRTVIVLLTDGLPNGVPTPVAGGSQDDSVLEAAAALQRIGVTLYAIGLGTPGAAGPDDAINDALLRRIASAPEMYFQTPDSGALTAIYESVARRLRQCR